MDVGYGGEKRDFTYDEFFIVEAVYVASVSLTVLDGALICLLRWPGPQHAEFKVSFDQGDLTCYKQERVLWYLLAQAQLDCAQEHAAETFRQHSLHRLPAGPAQSSALSATWLTIRYAANTTKTNNP